jgi:hypothetical protein
MKATFYKNGCPPEFKREGHIDRKGYCSGNLKGAVRRFAKIERNQPCPCGSNIKYKKCCKTLAVLVAFFKKKNEERKIKKGIK